jgi:exodeoxyribonuclease VII small subunit
MTRKQQETHTFEKSLAELETLVAKMEQGNLSLEESLQHFERGVQLTRACQQALKEAEQKVEILLKKSGQDELVPFTGEDA